MQWIFLIVVNDVYIHNNIFEPITILLFLIEFLLAKIIMLNYGLHI